MIRLIKILSRPVVLVLALMFFLFSYFYNDWYHKKVRRQPMMYCYEMFMEVINSPLIIERLKYKEKYIAYYQAIEKDIFSKKTVEFPLQGLPAGAPVYVMGYTEDSLLADVVSYADRGPRTGGSYTRAYVYTATLHPDPPPPRKSRPQSYMELLKDTSSYFNKRPTPEESRKAIEEYNRVVHTFLSDHGKETELAKFNALMEENDYKGAHALLLDVKRTIDAEPSEEFKKKVSDFFWIHIDRRWE